MANPTSTSGGSRGNPDPIPAAVVFGAPPALAATLVVGAEAGDVTIHVALAGSPFCALVLAPDDALSVSMWICAHVVDMRRGRQP